MHGGKGHHGDNKLSLIITNDLKDVEFTKLILTVAEPPKQRTNVKLCLWTNECLTIVLETKYYQWYGNCDTIYAIWGIDHFFIILIIIERYIKIIMVWFFVESVPNKDILISPYTIICRTGHQCRSTIPYNINTLLAFCYLNIAITHSLCSPIPNTYMYTGSFSKCYLL